MPFVSMADSSRGSMYAAAEYWLFRFHAGRQVSSSPDRPMLHVRYPLAVSLSNTTNAGTKLTADA